MTAMMLAPGQILSGRYQIIRELAQGGFGATFLAEDRHLPEHPLCVVKQLKPQTTEPTAMTIARRLFETEAQILHELGKHDQIPQLFAYFEEHQEFYLVEAYIEGKSLREEFRERGKLPADEVIEILKAILDILIFVHTNQVIHRDLNPSNLIRRQPDGKLCLIDFGAVKRVTTQFMQSSGGATVAIGTQGYLPSEQIQGRPQFGSDIYALGMIGIEALTGQMPHLLPADPQTAEIIWRNLVTVDDALAQVLNKMVRHDFRERFFTAQAARQALEELGQQTTATVVFGQPQGTTQTATPHQAPIPSNVSTLPTQMPITPTPASEGTNVLPVAVNSRDQMAIAAMAGLGVAALVSLAVSLNLGWQWWNNRQETLAQYEQGQVYQELNQPEKALDSYQEVLAEKPDHQGALLGKAQVLQQLQRYDEALKVYDELLTLTPQNWEAWWGRGKILSDRQQYDEALIALDKAIEHNPRSAAVWQTKAQIHLQRKETDAALASLDALLALDKKQAWAWYEKGWIHHQREQYPQAIAAYDRALKLDDSDPNIWYQQGNSFSKLEKYADAKRAYERVVNLKPDHAPAWYSLGIANENLKTYDTAQDAFAKVVELEPKNDRAWYHLAWNAEQRGDTNTAINAYRETVAINAKDRPSWRNLGELLYNAENYTEAIPAYETTLALDPKDGDIWEHLGNALKAEQRYQEAIAAYDQALTYKPNDPEIAANRQEAEDRLKWQETQDDLQEQADKLKEKADDLKEDVQDLLPWL